MVNALLSIRTVNFVQDTGPKNPFLCPDGRVATGEGRLAQWGRTKLVLPHWESRPTKLATKQALIFTVITYKSICNFVICIFFTCFTVSACYCMVDLLTSCMDNETKRPEMRHSMTSRWPAALDTQKGANLGLKCVKMRLARWGAWALP